MVNMISTLQIILALVLLLLGRRLYWAVVGAFGFIAATQWALANLQGQPEWAILAIGLAVGIIGAFAAIYLRMIGIGLAGFFGGAILVSGLLSLFGVPQDNLFTIFTIIGGILGIFLMFYLFDWAVILLSSISGASILTNQITTNDVPKIIVIFVIALIGVLLQSQDLKKR